MLDLGCGYGAVARSMAAVGALVTGVDILPANIGMAKAMTQGDAIRYLYADATRDLPDESFDVVVMSNVLDHIAIESAC